MLHDSFLQEIFMVHSTGSELLNRISNALVLMRFSVENENI
jgi:hypothetical protein